MKNQNDLKRELTKIDGKGYKAYKDLEGQYDFKDYILSIDHVQGDPFAAPSRVRVIVSQKVANIPMELFDKNYKKIAVQDFLTRLFYKLNELNLIKADKCIWWKNIWFRKKWAYFNK